MLGYSNGQEKLPIEYPLRDSLRIYVRRLIIFAIPVFLCLIIGAVLVVVSYVTEYISAEKLIQLTIVTLPLLLVFLIAVAMLGGVSVSILRSYTSSGSGKGNSECDEDCYRK